MLDILFLWDAFALASDASACRLVTERLAGGGGVTHPRWRQVRRDGKYALRLETLWLSADASVAQPGRFPESGHRKAAAS